MWSTYLLTRLVLQTNDKYHGCIDKSFAPVTKYTVTCFFGNQNWIFEWVLNLKEYILLAIQLFYDMIKSRFPLTLLCFNLSLRIIVMKKITLYSLTTVLIPISFLIRMTDVCRWPRAQPNLNRMKKSTTLSAIKPETHLLIYLLPYHTTPLS